MGFYSKAKKVYVDIEPEAAGLLLRLDDLKSRMLELENERSISWEMERMSLSDMRYALPEDFMTVGHVQDAIDLAKDDLFNRFGIDVKRRKAAEISQ